MPVTHLMSGKVAAEAAVNTESTIQHQKRGLLVYEGTFQSMDGEVEITAETIRRLAENHNNKLAAMQTEPQMADYPPIQLDHSTSASDTVGRLVGPVELGEFNGRVALYGNLRFLGLENWEKVEDGRWTHLSIGAELEQAVLQEITVTPFPAARAAVMLSRFGGEMNITEKLKRYMMSSENIDEKDANERMAKMTEEETAELKCKMEAEETDDKANLEGEDDKEKLSDGSDDDKANLEDEDDKEKLATQPEDDDKTRMSEDEDEEKANLEGEDDKEKLSKKRMQEDEDEEEKEEAKELKARMSAFQSRAGAVRLKLKTARLGATISRLRAQGKITPAEVKKVRLSELAKENDKTIDAVLKTYRDREPVIHMGQYGSLKAKSAQDVAKEISSIRLQAETMKSMSWTAKALGIDPAKMNTVHLSEGENTVAGTTENEDVQMMGDHEAMWDEIVRAMRDGRDADAKAIYLRSAKMQSGDTSVGEEEVAELMGAFADLENEFSSVVRLTSAQAGVKL